MPPAKKTSGGSPPELLPVDYAVLDALVEGKHATPHEVLGPHEHDGGVTIRVLRPAASAVRFAQASRLRRPAAPAPGWSPAAEE